MEVIEVTTWEENVYGVSCSYATENIVTAHNILDEMGGGKPFNKGEKTKPSIIDIKNLYIRSDFHSSVLDIARFIYLETVEFESDDIPLEELWFPTNGNNYIINVPKNLFGLECGKGTTIVGFDELLEVNPDVRIDIE